MKKLVRHKESRLAAAVAFGARSEVLSPGRQEDRVRSLTEPPPARAVANDDDVSPAAREHVRAQTRELAQRLSGTVEVLLLWRPESDRVELSVRDLATDAGFSIVIAPGDAIDSFYHPYAYAARRENSHDDERDEAMIVDG